MARKRAMSNTRSGLSRDHGVYHLEAWRTSGKAMSIYCADAGVDFIALRAWAAAAGKSSWSKNSIISEKSPTQTSFVRVRVAEEATKQPMDTVLEVVAGDGLLIRLRDGSADTLMTVVRILRASSC